MVDAHALTGDRCVRTDVGIVRRLNVPLGSEVTGRHSPGHLCGAEGGTLEHPSRIPLCFHPQSRHPQDHLPHLAKEILKKGRGELDLMNRCE